MLCPEFSCKAVHCQPAQYLREVTIHIGNKLILSRMIYRMRGLDIRTNCLGRTRDGMAIILLSIGYMKHKNNIF